MRTKKKATTAIILDKRYSLKSKDKKEKDVRREDRTYPVKLRVTSKRVTRFYGIDIALTERDWQKLHSEKLKDEDLKEVRKKISEEDQRAEEIIKKLPTFTFEAFRKIFVSEQGDLEDVYFGLKRYKNKLEEEDRISTAYCFASAISSLKRFRESLKFSEVTISFLQSYENWMRKVGNSNTNGPASSTTIGMYLRCLKTACLIATEEGVIDKSAYPFGARKYKIPTGKNVKKALNLKEIEQIFKLEFTHKQYNKEMGRNFWIWSYLGNGMNMKDVCHLKRKNFHGDKFVFIRKKTARTCSANPKPITVILTPHMRQIMERYSNEDQSPESYVFPFLSDEMDEKEKHKKVKSMIGMVNRAMKYVFKVLGIVGKNPNSMSARHSFSTVIKRLGGSTEFIQDALGHTSKNTTENYLDEFEEDVKRHYANALTAFDVA